VRERFPRARSTSPLNKDLYDERTLVARALR
jgi:hypothetical protein